MTSQAKWLSLGAAVGLAVALPVALLASQSHWVTGFNVAVAVAKSQWCYHSTAIEANALTAPVRASGLEAKRLGLLHELVPKATSVAVLTNPNFADVENQLRDAQGATARLGLQLVVVRANTESDFDVAFSTIVQHRAGALQVSSSPFFNGRREQLVILAARHAVPAIFEWRDFAAVDDLMSYGTNLADAYRQVGVYAGQILRGAKPGDLPVV
jgi:putative tryptophan/tyrosine transport system substrate-binding protein